jgi:hypothetical protein
MLFKIQQTSIRKLFVIARSLISNDRVFLVCPFGTEEGTFASWSEHIASIISCFQNLPTVEACILTPAVRFEDTGDMIAQGHLGCLCGLTCRIVNPFAVVRRGAFLRQ